MFILGLKWLRLQTKLSITIFALKSLVINSTLLFYVIKEKLINFDIEQQQDLLYVITLVVRFLAGTVTDVELVIGAYFGMKSLLIISAVWKVTTALFDFGHSMSFAPEVYSKTYEFVDKSFNTDLLDATYFYETGFCTLYLLLAVVMIYGAYRVNVYFRSLYFEEGRMTTVDVAASLLSCVSNPNDRHKII
ncbi:uncharacterized protein LOC135366093 [Ornithodoros turicata]|uniref:uncharacterized protein LOC135366093 n=1 Tax=Ornithodoros turicata TaxID=34597 RepID=UPI003139208E